MSWIAFLWAKTCFPLVFYFCLGTIIVLTIYQIEQIIERWLKQKR